MCPLVSPLSAKAPVGGWRIEDLGRALGSPAVFANGNPLDLRSTNASAAPPDLPVPSGTCEDHCFQARIGPGPRVSVVDLSDASVVFWFLMQSKPAAAIPAAGGRLAWVWCSAGTVLEVSVDRKCRLLSLSMPSQPVAPVGSGNEFDPWVFDVPVAPARDPPLALPRFGGGFEFQSGSSILCGPLEGSPYASLEVHVRAAPDPLPPPAVPQPHPGPWWTTYRLPRASRAPRPPLSIPAGLAVDLLDEDAPVRPVRTLRPAKPRKPRAAPPTVRHEIPEPKPAKRPKRSGPIRDGFRGKMVGAGLNQHWTSQTPKNVKSPAVP